MDLRVGWTWSHEEAARRSSFGPQVKGSKKAPPKKRGCASWVSIKSFYLGSIQTRTHTHSDVQPREEYPCLVGFKGKPKANHFGGGPLREDWPLWRLPHPDKAVHHFFFGRRAGARASSRPWLVSPEASKASASGFTTSAST